MVPRLEGLFSFLQKDLAIDTPTTYEVGFLECVFVTQGESTWRVTYTWSEAGYTPAINEHDVDLNREDIVAYGRGKTLYVWHISNPVLYRNPIPFNEADFRRPCISPEMPYCPSCRFGIEHISEGEQEALRAFGSCNTQWVCLNWLKKPPQSWCYISGEKHVAVSELF